MKHLKLLFAVLFMLVIVPVRAQQFTVTTLVPQGDDRDAVLSGFTDDNGKTCLLIKVQTTDKTLGFETTPKGGVIEVQTPVRKHPNETWVYIKPNCKYFRIMHPRYGLPQGEGLTNGFLPLPANANTEGMVYKCVVTIPQTTVEAGTDRAPEVIVTANPNKSWLSVDNELTVATPRVVNLKPGVHQFELNAPNYRTLKVSVDANTLTTDTTLHYELTKMYGNLHLTAQDCNPMFHVIGIRDVAFHLANKQKRSFDDKLFPGHYLVFGTGWRRQMQMHFVNINDADSLTYNFKLKHLPLHVFAFGTMSKPSGLDDKAYGAMVGFVRRRGLYFSMQQTQNFKANGDPVSFEEMKLLCENPYLNSAHCYYRAVSGGVVLRLWSPVHIYAGLGRAERQFTWDGKDGLRHMVPNYRDHKKGMLKECGLMVNLWKIGLMGGISEYDGVKNAQLGVGIYW